MCRPPRDAYVITETVATIPLQPLAIHTVDRILEIQWVQEVVMEMKKEAENEILELELEGKIGSDTYVVLNSTRVSETRNFYVSRGPTCRTYGNMYFALVMF